MARLKNSADQQSSRQVQGGVIDRFNNRLGWWERRDLPNRTDDIQYTVTSTTAGRPDLIAVQVYGQNSYAWLILQYNNIVDVATELIPGKELLLPAVTRLMLDIINQPVGGKQVS